MEDWTDTHTYFLMEVREKTIRYLTWLDEFAGMKIEAEGETAAQSFAQMELEKHREWWNGLDEKKKFQIHKLSEGDEDYITKLVVNQMNNINQYIDETAKYLSMIDLQKEMSSRNDIEPPLIKPLKWEGTKLDLILIITAMIEARYIDMKGLNKIDLYKRFGEFLQMPLHDYNNLLGKYKREPTRDPFEPLKSGLLNYEMRGKKLKK